MNKILVTGFDPFNKETINPSYEAVKLLKDKIKDFRVIKRELPTEYLASLEVLNRIIDEVRPRILILVGQAGGRSSLTIERVALNLREASIPDNTGKIFKNQKIYEDGSDGYFSNLPLYKIVEGLKKEGIPAGISNTAGLFVCNNVLYNSLYRIDKEKLDMKAGFVHVPFIPEQALENPSRPTMELDKIVLALENLIETTIRNL